MTKTFPKNAVFVRRPNQLYTIMDFHDGDILELYSTERNERYAWYQRKTKPQDIRLVSIDEVEELL